MPVALQSVGYPRKMRRIERLINLIAALLETRRPLSAGDIREKIAGYGEEPTFEAFRRSFERDKEALRAMGVPLEVVPLDPFGVDPDGYIIPKSKYYLPELDLEPDELAALRLAAEAILGGAEEAGSGLLKLSVGETEGSWGGPRIMWGADVAAEQPLLGPLLQALVDRTPVSFTYVSGSGDKGERRMEPYGLVHRRGNWYLVGRDVDRAAIRAFKVSRIEGEVASLEGSYSIPEGFDAGEHVGREAWEVGGGEPQTAIVRVDPDTRWWVEQNLAPAKTTDLPDGSLEIELPVTNVDALVSWVLGLGDKAVIVAPEEARAALVEHLQPIVGRAR